MSRRNTYTRRRRGDKQRNLQRRRERKRAEREANRAFYDFFKSVRDDGHAIDSRDDIPSTDGHDIQTGGHDD